MSVGGLLACLAMSPRWGVVLHWGGGHMKRGIGMRAPRAPRRQGFGIEKVWLLGRSTNGVLMGPVHDVVVAVQFQFWFPVTAFPQWMLWTAAWYQNAQHAIQCSALPAPQQQALNKAAGASILQPRKCKKAIKVHWYFSQKPNIYLGRKLCLTPQCDASIQFSKLGAELFRACGLSYPCIV